MRHLLFVLMLGVTAVPVQAVTVPKAMAPVPVEADRLLWCGSAFYWLGIDASDAGNDKEAEQYQGWSDELLDRAATLLAAGGLDADGTGDQIESYASRTLEEMAAPDAPYDVATVCPTLVSP